MDATAKPLRHAGTLPGPRGLPLLGNALQIDSPRMHQQLEAWAREFGPYYRFRIGPRHFTVIADHAAVAAALRDRPDGFRRTQRLEQIWLELGLPPGVFGANGDSWRAQRRMVMAAFAPERVRRWHPALLRVADRLGRRWQRAAAAGEAIDLQPELMRYTVDVIAGLALGSEVNTLEDDGDIIQRQLDKIFPSLFRRILKPLPTWRWWKTADDRALEAAVHAVNAAVQDFVAQARQRLAADPARRADPPNLLESMLVAADEPAAPGTGIDDRLVAGNVLTMLLAGEDTTANTLAWMIHLLWRHPEALARAGDEVRRVCTDGALPTHEQLAELDWVEACAHETMRLKPVAPVLPLQALRDVQLGDVLLPAGSVIVNLMRHDSVRDDHVPHAARFDPERWLDGRQPGANSAKRISMPFGAGPRICPGRYLALMEIKMALAMLLTRFRITHVGTAEGAEPAEHLAFTMAPVGLQMRLAPA
jgi:cytochrome P450